MGTYSIDGTELRTYGVGVERSEGALDFCTRKDLGAFGWFDEDGQQAYVSSDLIKFQARDITLFCHFRADQADFKADWNAFIDLLAAPGMRSLVTPYSTKAYSVYLNTAINVAMLTGRLAEKRVIRFQLHFTEPVTDDIPGTPPALPDPIPALAAGRYGLDGYDLRGLLGMTVTSIDNLYGKPAVKQYPKFSDIWANGERVFTEVENRHYEARDIVVRGHMVANTQEALVTNLGVLKYIIFQANTRTLTVPGDGNYTVYCKDGGRVEMVTKPTAPKAVAMFNLNLRIV